ncbi:hypothetical protein SDC9_122032 [bioreactor metagenome]|uniref:Uncharacterized protein n=1 Tax=bioreactor metagenome TaxID=1076179 RepID=A0A645CDQ2_9ZZZZ
MHGELRKAHHRIGQAVDVHRRSAPKAREQGGAAQRPQHVLRLRLRHRRKPALNVAQQFHQHATKAHGDERPELHVVDHPQCQFHTFRRHALHQHAFDVGIGSVPPCRRLHLFKRCLERCGITDVQPHHAHLRLVRDVGRLDLDRHGIADACCRTLGRSDVLHQCIQRHGNARCRQQLLGQALGQHLLGTGQQWPNHGVVYRDHRIRRAHVSLRSMQIALERGKAMVGREERHQPLVALGRDHARAFLPGAHPDDADRLVITPGDLAEHGHAALRLWRCQKDHRHDERGNARIIQKRLDA